MSSYRQSRTCSKCGTEESRILSKLEAAFEERRCWTTPCGSCGSTSFSSSGGTMPPFDEEVLLEWATHADLTILQQDEDLILADVESLPLLKQFVLRSDVLPGKRSVLLSALCVLIYDNIPDEDDPAATNESLLKDVTRFLIDNVKLFQSIDDSYIHNYVKVAVYP